MTVSERLRKALDWSDFTSIHSFKNAVVGQFPDVKGRSYSSVHSYFKGVNPPLEFLEAAAEMLGVRIGWLRTGDGSMEHRRSREDEDPNEGSRIVVWPEFYKCTEGDPWLRELASDIIISSWWNAMEAILRSCPDFRDGAYPEDALTIIGTWVCQQATSSVKILRGGTPDSWPPGWSRTGFHGYFNLMFQAIANAAPDPNQGQPIEELLRALKPAKKARKRAGK